MSRAHRPRGQEEAPLVLADAMGGSQGTTTPDGTVPIASPIRSHADIRRFALAIVGGPDAGKRWVSDGERGVVGTHASAQLVLTDEAVSRFHFEVVIVDDRIAIRDLGSRNGTNLDGVDVRDAWLRDGATIAVGRSKLRFELRSDDLRLNLSEKDGFGTMVGASVPMRRTFAVLEKAAASDATVLLEGETGTGKEVAAESIHAASARAQRPFIVVDCSAIPADLLEAELFGWEKGAFTGATGARKGAFEAADGGTVFLDEIGELPAELQPKLLRVLEKKQVKRLGTAVHESVDVRVIAATNRSLRQEVNAKRFRSDLYYRLAVVEVRLPPLRERREDIPLLVDRLLAHLDASGPAAETMRSAESLKALAEHAFPGNVRELRNYLERCLTLRERLPLEGADAPADDDGGAPAIAFDKPLRVAREAWTRAFERRYLQEVLARHDGNVSAAARAAGVDRMHFYRLLWRQGLK